MNMDCEYSEIKNIVINASMNTDLLSIGLTYSMNCELIIMLEEFCWSLSSCVVYYDDSDYTKTLRI